MHFGQRTGTLIFALVGTVVMASLVYAATSYRVTGGGGSMSAGTEFGNCRTIVNNSGYDLFVPTNTSAEWQAFLNYAPIGVTLNTCPTCTYAWGSTQRVCADSSNAFPWNSGVTETCDSAHVGWYNILSNYGSNCRGPGLGVTYTYQQCIGTGSSCAAPPPSCTYSMTSNLSTCSTALNTSLIVGSTGSCTSDSEVGYQITGTSPDAFCSTNPMLQYDYLYNQCSKTCPSGAATCTWNGTAYASGATITNGYQISPSTGTCVSPAASTCTNGSWNNTIFPDAASCAVLLATESWHYAWGSNQQSCTLPGPTGNCGGSSDVGNVSVVGSGSGMPVCPIMFTYKVCNKSFY